MFSKKRKQQELATQKGLGIAVQPQSPPPPAQLRPPHDRTTSNSTSASNTVPLVSPLRMTFDFELPPSPALSTNSPFKSSLDSTSRPQTSDGAASINGRSNMTFVRPRAPPVKPSASTQSIQSADGASVELEGSAPTTPSTRIPPEIPRGTPPPPPLPPLEPPAPRFDTDNVSTSSSKSRRKSRIRSFFFGYDPPPDIGNMSRPSSSSGTQKPPPVPAIPRGESPRPATSGSGTAPKMESSLFPAKQSSQPVLPPFNADTPVMTREWLDARDKPYASRSKRTPLLQSNNSTPDLTAQKGLTSSPSMNFSNRSPLSNAPDSPAVESRPSPRSFATSPAGQFQRQPSHAPTTHSTSTAKSNASSKASKDTGSVLTVGTPYQETSPSFPTPQFVGVRPKTAGAQNATLGGIQVPTHHSSSLPRPNSSNNVGDAPTKTTEKSERRKTRLLNPMALLSRRKSAQDDEAVNAEKAAQAVALQRQSKVIASGGVDRRPADFDPSIRGRVVHDFSAPRQPVRGFSHSDMDALSPQSSVKAGRGTLQTANSVPYISNPIQPPEEEQQPPERKGPKLTFVGQSFHSHRYPSSDSSSTGRRTTGFFQEHLGDGNEATGGIRAERLENKDFLKRASYLSQQSSVGSSSESAVLPVFARRSQHWDDASKRGSAVTSGQRDSGVSSMSGVSPVTNSGRVSANVPFDVSANFSPVSPSSDNRESRGISEAGTRPVSSVRPISTISKASSHKERIKSPSGTSLNEPVEPMPQPFSRGPSTNVGSEAVAGVETESPRPPISITIPVPPPTRMPPEVPPRSLSAANTGMSPLSTINSPGVEFPSGAPTPEPQVADSIQQYQHPTSPPKLVEKRASAVGHSSKRPMNSGVKHHVSNASRFSFQMGGGSAEEQALEAKARRMTMNGEGVGNTLGDDDDEDFFDEDAMDDMDEMEMMGESQAISNIPVSQQSLPSPPAQSQSQSRSQSQHQRSTSTTTTATANTTRDRANVSQFLYRPATANNKRATQMLDLQIDDGDSGESEDEEDDEAPYWMHEDFMGYSDHSRQTSVAEGAGSPMATAAETRTRGMSASSGLTLDTTVGMNGAVGAARGVLPPQQPQRDSSGSERNKILSDMNFTSTNIDSSARMTQHTPAMSGSTIGGSTSSEARTLSTGLGLSGFSDFRFSDSAPPTRPTSLQADVVQPGAKENRRTRDSETIPRDVNWTAESGQPSPAMKSNGRLSSGWTEQAPAPNSWNRRPSSPLVPVNAGANKNEDDDMYFDDGGFDQDINDGPTANGQVFDEDAFDDPNFLARNNSAAQAVHPCPPKAQQYHHREPSAMTVTSLGSDGPYPSFAMPNATKARQRDSRMLLEDLPLQTTGPVDPKLIPQRNPSEDAKRLGLHSRAPPLPPQPGGDPEETDRRMRAYHKNLADALNQAALDGRFLRVPSVKSVESENVVPGESGDLKSPQPSMVSHVSGEVEGSAVGGAVKEEESTLPKSDLLTTDYIPPKLDFDFGFNTDAADDDYDAFMNDDDIVAAANAEALASDDDGFYGSEFGFYAKARPNSGDLEAINGGYFGADGDDGLARNKSLKEPNLTPITERSEFSTRNSFIGTFGPMSAGFGPPSSGPMSAGSLAPGVSPSLARMPISPLGENEVTSFDQLRKLRAHAFGGSSASSLHSEGRRNSQSSLVNGNGESPTHSARSSAQGHVVGGAPMVFGYSTDSSGSQPQRQDFQDSPHSASSSLHLPFSATTGAVGENEGTPRRGTVGSNEIPVTVKKASASHSTVNKISTHSRTSSGADSVTYVKEASPDGPPRWVLERRRTSEQGLSELVDRRVLESGWI
jgi:hypothetical protein